MDKIPAILLAILLVVVVFAGIFFKGMAPALDTKADSVITDMNGANFTGNNN